MSLSEVTPLADHQKSASFVSQRTNANSDDPALLQSSVSVAIEEPGEDG